MNTTPNAQKMRLPLADPIRFVEISDAILPWLSAITLFFLILGLILVVRSPDDYQQGITVRIMYIHAPFAWLSILCYVAMSISALGSLVWDHYLADIALKCAAPIGAVFTALALMTGALWGRPTWGTWWVWDARLTSVLILFFIYLAIITLAHAFRDRTKSARATAILTLVGFVNIPIIKFSVNWWNTLHQPASLLRWGGPAIDRSMLYPLITMMFCFTSIFILVHLMAMKNEILFRHIQSLQVKEADQYRESSS